MLRIFLFFIDVLAFMLAVQPMLRGQVLSEVGINAAASFPYAQSVSMSASQTVWLAHQFMRPTAGTLNTVNIWTYTVTGTVGTSDVRVEVLAHIGGTAKTVTYDDPNDKVLLTAASTYLSNGDKIAFQAATTLPVGIPTKVSEFYVCNVTTTDFQIDDDSGCGSVVTDFSGSSGTQNVRKILGSTSTISASPTTNSWIRATGLSVSIQAGVPYWLTYITSGSGTWNARYSGYYHANTYAGMQQIMPAYVTGGGAIFGSMIGSSSSGSTANLFGLRLDFSDSSYLGWPFQSIATGSGATGGACEDQEVGTRYVLPSDATYRISGVALCHFGPHASVTYGMRLRLYTGADGAETLAGTSQTYPMQWFETSGTYVPCTVGYFTTVEVAGGTPVRVMLGEATDSGDTCSTASWRVSEWAFENAAASKALIYGGRASHAKKDGSSWTYTDTKLIPFAIILDGSDQFATSATGGGSYAIAQ